MEVIELAVKNIENLAADNSHGYDQANRWGPDYDCSSAVITAWQNAGVPVKTNGATYTGNMRNAFLASGFTDVTSQVDLMTGSGLQRGDVLLNYSSHTAMYVGYGTIAHASLNENGGTTGGLPGDQTGREICLRSYYNYPWNCVLRYRKKNETNSNPTPISDAIPTVKKEEPVQIICEPHPKMPMLVKGDRDDPSNKNSGYVEILQRRLIRKGFTCGGYGADGIFGNGTEQSVKNFQEENSLEIDGKVGPAVWTKLLSV